MKKYSLWLICFVIISNSFIDSFAQQHVISDSSKSLVLNISEAEEIKDSMIQNGWLYQASFPFFKKEAKTGKAPKSCVFSPDAKYIYVTLLNSIGNGVMIYDLQTMKCIDTVKPPCIDTSENWGYAEGVFCEIDSSFWFTRMSNNNFFILEGDDLSKTYSTHGTWPKIIEFNPSNKLVAISNWISNTVTIFNEKDRKLNKTIKTAKTPRGIAWINDSIMAVASFGEGIVQVFNILSNKCLDTISYGGYAARDIHYDATKNILYFNDMRYAKVYKYDYTRKKLLASEKVDEKTNSMRLTKDGKYLFVSCRGPNNSEGYTLRSPRNGFLYLIRTKYMKTIRKWEGGNQPTGMAISPDEHFIATTDFQDNRLNVYFIRK